MTRETDDPVEPSSAVEERARGLLETAPIRGKRRSGFGNFRFVPLETSGVRNDRVRGGADHSVPADEGDSGQSFRMRRM
jgi:hypothetical protein